MKVLKLFLGSLLISMIFNLKGNDGIKLERFWTDTYWIWTLSFALAIAIAGILIRFRMKVMWIHWQKKYPKLELLKEDRLQTGSLPKEDRVWAIVSTTVSLLLVYLCFIFLIAFVRSNDTNILFRSYLVHYMPFITIGCLFYVRYIFNKGQLWWFTPPNAIALFNNQFPEKIIPVERTIEKVVTLVPPNILDEVIVIGSLYDVLYNHAKFDPDRIKKDAVRMFDVPFYFSAKGRKEVVLIDGTRQNADRYMQELEALGLDKWYFRISKSCRVNMMLIRYPVSPNTGQLEFRKEVFDNLRSEMTKMEIFNLLLVTEWIRKEKKLAKFLDNVHNLRHKGWDNLTPLN